MANQPGETSLNGWLALGLIIFVLLTGLAIQSGRRRMR